jgi:hypothetical protein
VRTLVPLVECSSDLQRDDIVGRAAPESAIELRKAPGTDSIDQPARLYLAAPALFECAFGKAPANRALIAHHKQNILLLRNCRQPLAYWIAGAQTEEIVVKEEDSNYLCTMVVLFKLRQDHRCKFGRAR